MLNKNIAEERIKLFIKKCAKEKGIKFQKVILFGSTVNGKANRYSDIDVALVSDMFTGNPITDWQMLTPVLISNRKFIDIEPHPYIPEDFEEDPFAEVIKKTGIELNIVTDF